MSDAGIRSIIEEVRANVQRQRDALALEIVAELQRKPPQGTPVKTGYARAMWIPVLGQPALTPERARVTGTAAERNATMRNMAVSARARQQAAIASLLADGPGQPEVSAHVYNPAVYVNRLNERGGQSPPGWVEASVARAVIARQAAVRAVQEVL